MGIDWEGIRRDYCDCGVSFSELSKRYKCGADTIRKRAGREGWKKAACKKGGEQAQPPEEDERTKPEDVLDEHRVLWRGVKRRLVKGLKTSDAKVGLEELKVAKIAGEVLTNVIKGERQAWGLEQNCEGQDDREEIAGEMVCLTLPPGTEETVD
ncbi:MAG: hypothetical protein HZB22_05305 [Deltaproteobacteria bacterium]|nr:hypothetical protein [Deltaproteobacteria bacterium]